MVTARERAPGRLSCDMSGPSWPLGIPTRLRPLAVLAAGEATIVWKVRDTEVGTDLAVKVITVTEGSTVDPALRAETEARALARLAGLDGVVALRELGRCGSGAAWLAYDLVTGGTLADRAPCGAHEVVEVGATVARTLAEAHRRLVHHGDISPANVVFDAAGTALLADFGMAGLGHAPDDPGGLTPAFAPPERLRGSGPAASADVYSLAATLLAVTAPTARDEVASVLDRCWNEDPSERPSAAALADALRAVRPR